MKRSLYTPSDFLERLFGHVDFNYCDSLILLKCNLDNIVYPPDSTNAIVNSYIFNEVANSYDLARTIRLNPRDG